MSGVIEQVRDAIVASLSTALGQPVDVETHPGRFNAQELRRYSKKAPVVLVAAMSVPTFEDEPRPGQAVVQWAAFVVTKDAPGNSRDAQAITLSEAVMQHIRRNDWGNSDVSKPERVNAENLYSAEIDKVGVAMWAVSWRQKVAMQPVKDVSELADFALYSATHEIGDADTLDTETLQDIPTD